MLKKLPLENHPENVAKQIFNIYLKCRRGQVWSQEGDDRNTPERKWKSWKKSLT
ncbi:MAG: hypothetical protein QMD13_00020 [Candidatus Bathyarchaeia archaeon]|nr:hypothetical protein [Candidatus Bathyarchaeia archaeon]